MSTHNEIEKDFFNQPSQLIYTRTPSLIQNYGFLLEVEKSLKEEFKKMEDTEEHNTFFELFLEKIIKDLNFHIIEFDDFNTMDNQQKIKELIQDMKLIVDNNLTNLETNTGALKNINIIKDFYANNKIESAQILESLSFTEEKFSMKNSAPKLKIDFDRTKNYVEKISKTIIKIRKTQLSFTIEDTLLSEFIDKISDEEIEQLNLEQIIENDSKAKLVLTKLINDIQTVLAENFNRDEAEFNQRIKDLSRMFVNFFTNQENPLFKYLVQSYLYRDKVFDEILDDCSIYMSQMLRKITAYKTILLINFYKDTLDFEINQKLKESKDIIKGFYNSKQVNADYFNAKNLNDKAKQIINFLKNKLTQKKTTQQDFNNDLINTEIPKILSNLNQNSERHYQINKEELDTIEKIKDHLESYKDRLNEMESIKFQKMTLEIQIEIHQKLREFNESQSQIERQLDIMSLLTETQRRMREIILTNKKTYQDLLNMYFKDTQINSINMDF